MSWWVISALRRRVRLRSPARGPDPIRPRAALPTDRHRTGLTPVIDPALADLNAGSWRGRRLADLVKTEPEAVQVWITDPAATPHGGESLRALLDRVAGWLGEVSACVGHIVAITHPSII